MTKVKIGQVYKGIHFKGVDEPHTMGRVKVDLIEKRPNDRYSIIHYSDENGEYIGYTDTKDTFLHYFKFDLLATFKLKMKKNK